jgi:hypothetical protein
VLDVEVYPSPMSSHKIDEALVEVLMAVMGDEKLSGKVSFDNKLNCAIG